VKADLREEECAGLVRSPDRAAIIGGGISGLTAAYELTRRGYKVTLFEQDARLGGLAGSTEIQGIPVEKYYHFICLNDRPYREMLGTLGLTESLVWTETSMGYFYQGRIYPFSKPADLLRFSPLSLFNRLRFGVSILYSTFLKDWRRLESVSARDWLIKHVGEEAFFVIWEPLLRIKFGSRAPEISAAWIWSRAQRVASSRVRGMQQELLGYVRGGTDVVIDALAVESTQRGAQIAVSSPVERIVIEDEAVKGLIVGGRFFAYDQVVSSVPLPVLLRLAPGLPDAYRRSLEQIEYIGIVCLMLILRRPLTKNFWLNINDPGVPYAGIIEYSNLNPLPQLGGRKLAYVPYYVPLDDPRYRLSDDQLRRELLASLPSVIPGFAAEWVEECRVFRDAYAQPVCTMHHSQRIPRFRTPVRGLFVTDASQIYPEDRGVSNCIWLGQRVAEEILSNKTVETPMAIGE